MFRKNMFPVILLSSFLFLSYYTLFHVSFIFLTSTSTVKFTLAFTNETDRQSLLSIKNHILEDPLNVLSSWNNSLHFCDWQGITCSAHHERVIVLNLSSLQLAGSLSPHIGNLSFLGAIHLDNNRFNGAIPPEMGRLFRLQNLSFYGNSFEGGLPSSLSNCSKMRNIIVHNNNLGGEIPAELGSLSGLQGLRLGKNHFCGRIPPSLGNLSALLGLALYYNNLEGSIPDELGHLSNLEHIDLGENNLSGEIPAALYNSSSVIFFGVAFNKLQGSLTNFFLSLPKLQRFHAGNNQFSGSIPPSIANASELADFDIGGNKLTGSLPMNLGSLQNLEYFSVSDNQLGSSGVNDLGFFTSLSNCSNLSVLQLGINQFVGELPSTIANLSTKLICLRLGKNPIYGNIPPEMGNLVNLAFLDLLETMLTGSVPNSIGKLTNLQEFYLYNTKISGKIPYSIGNISRLSVLILRQNRLEGDIPVSLGDCQNLIGLDLSFNRLTGAIPEQNFELSSLSISLSLKNNFLSGPLSQVGDMKNIGKLDVSENQLSGNFPSTLGSCQVLEFLYLEGNHFEGIVPSSFQQLRGIQFLDLSRNNLSGQIPSFFGEFTLIQILNLSNNLFEGEVPIKGVFKNISAFSIEGNEKLCGGIKELRLPACPTEVLKKRTRLNHRVIIPLLITPIFVLFLVSLLVILRKTRRSPLQIDSGFPLQDLHPKLSYAELLQATNGFSSENLIGEGRYGSIYKAIINPGEQVVAVKVLKLRESGANKSFTAECEALGNIRHRNLVKIITSCSSTDFNGNDFKALVYEFVPNGTLHDWLHPLSFEQQERKNLSLIQRINVAIDVASVLDYLHHHCKTTICHCDLKPSNVLLDNDFCAHLSDFGLARILLASIDDESIHGNSTSTGIIGTIGYIPPEYGISWKVSIEGDVYSYGIFLLEMFTGKRPTSNIFVENFSLHNYAQMALPDRAMEIVDPRLLLEDEGGSNRSRQSQRGNSAEIEECMRSILQIGVLCSAELSSERMNLRDVLIELYKVKKNISQVGLDPTHASSKS